MKNILVILFSLATFYVSAQEVNQFDANGKRHGVWKKNYKNSNILRYEGQFNHGKEIGVFKFYENIDKKAVLVASRTFNEMNSLAEVKFVTPKGNTVSEGKMNGKTYVGKWKYYHKDSNQIMTEEFYNDKGELNGERKTFYLSGKIAASAIYKLDKLDGKSKWYSEKGKLIRFFSYKDGILHGEAKAYDPNGDLNMEGVYRNDKKYGIWKYYKNGKFLRQKDYTRKSKNPKYRKTKN